MDRLHHLLDDRVEDLAGLLRVARSQQLHRALHVGEEHRDVLAFALESRLRRQDFLSEVLWRIGLRRAKAVRSGGWSTDCLAAFETELRACRNVCTAVTTLVGKPNAALHAELRLGRILVLAPGTLHLTLSCAKSVKVGTAGRT